MMTLSDLVYYGIKWEPMSIINSDSCDCHISDERILSDMLHALKTITLPRKHTPILNLAPSEVKQHAGRCPAYIKIVDHLG